MKTTPGAPFKTSDLDAAAFLLTKDFRLLDVEKGTRSTFVFEPAAAQAVAEFYSGGMVCAQDFGSAIREIKAAIFRNPYPTTTNARDNDDHARRQPR